MVEAVVRVSEGFSLDSVAALIEGVTQTDLSRWQRGDWKWLSRAKESALRKFLEAHGGEEGARRYVVAELGNVTGLSPEEARRVRDLAREILSIVGSADVNSARVIARAGREAKAARQADRPPPEEGETRRGAGRRPGTRQSDERD